jgi:hypothetical protein
MYATCPAHLIIIGDYSNYIWRKVRVMKLLITQFSPPPTISSLFGPNILFNTCSCSLDLIIVMLESLDGEKGGAGGRSRLIETVKSITYQNGICQATQYVASSGIGDRKGTWVAVGVLGALSGHQKDIWYHFPRPMSLLAFSEHPHPFLIDLSYRNQQIHVYVRSSDLSDIVAWGT